MSAQQVLWVRTVTKATGLPHEPEAHCGTQGNPTIDKDQDEERHIERRDTRRGGHPQDGRHQGEERQTEEQQVAVAPAAQQELPSSSRRMQNSMISARMTDR